VFFECTGSSATPDRAIVDSIFLLSVSELFIAVAYDHSAYIFKVHQDGQNQ
jgi:hypothetical protein